MFIAVYMYTTPKIFPSNVDDLIITESDYMEHMHVFSVHAAEINYEERYFNNSQIYPYVVLLGFTVLYFLLDFTILKFLRNCC